MTEPYHKIAPTALVFCAGLGTRFKPWTDHHPKALAMIHGKSLLQRNVEYLQQYGIRRVIVNVHHFADQIIEAIQQAQGWGSEILISDERDAVLETGGGLRKAQALFTPGERFITCNADILTNINIHALWEFHEQQQALISMAVGDRSTSRYLLFNQENRLCGWKNISTGEEKISYPSSVLIPKSYDCVVVFDYAVFNQIPFTGKFSLIDLYLHLAKTQPIKGFAHQASKWIDVGRPEMVHPAEKMFASSNGGEAPT